MTLNVLNVLALSQTGFIIVNRVLMHSSQFFNVSFSYTQKGANQIFVKTTW